MKREDAPAEIERQARAEVFPSRSSVSGEMFGEACEVWMVSRVLGSVLPDDIAVFDEEVARQNGHVADGLADEVAFGDCLNAARPNRRTEELREIAALQTEGRVEALGRVGNGARPVPEAGKKILAVFDRALIDKDDLWIRRVFN